MKIETKSIARLVLRQKGTFHLLLDFFFFFLQRFKDFEYFLINFGQYFDVLGKYEIQDGRQKMAAVLTSRNCRVM